MTPRFAFTAEEASGALGDLGTLLPIMLGAVAVAGLAPGPVVLGFAAFYIATAFIYRLPVPVQPMKAVAAVLLIGAATPATVAAAGVMIGFVLILLGATGWIDRLGRVVPQSLMTGLQLGLGLSLGLVALDLMATAPLAAAAGLAVLALLLVRGRLAALVFAAVSIAAGATFGLPGAGGFGMTAGWALPAWPVLADWTDGLRTMVLPQLSLTVTNAILLTALLLGERFGDAAAHVTPRRLALTSGIATALLAPLGALPMCHGAGGVAAHHRFGARTGGAPLMLGLALAALALVPGGLAVLALIPAAALGAMLLVAAVELAASRRLIDCVPSCRPVIAVTALATVAIDPFAGIVLGTAAEIVRKMIVRRIYGSRNKDVAL